MKKRLKGIIFGFTICSIFGISSASLSISSIELSNGGNSVSIGSTPKLYIQVRNDGQGIESGSHTLECLGTNTLSNQTSTKSITISVNLDAGASIRGEITMGNSLTSTGPSTVSLSCNIDGIGQNSATFTVAQQGRYDSALERAITPVRNHLDTPQPNSTIGGGDSIRIFIFNIISDIITPIVIVIGVLMGILGAYKLFFSGDEAKMKSGLTMILYGVIGIIIMLSAKYIGKVIVEDIFNIGDTTGIDGVELASNIYEKIAYPFIKLALYLALGVLFIILATKVIGIVTKSDGSGTKKAGSIIARSSIGMLIIIGAKNIVEAIYGKQNDVLNANAQNIGDIGTGILVDKNLPLIFTIVNRGLGLITLLILILILVQAFKILLTPEKADNRKKFGKSILYILIGVFIIGIAYILTNALIIN